MSTITCDLTDVLPITSDQTLFSISCTDIIFVFEFKAWLKLLFGITEPIKAMVGNETIMDLDTIDVLKNNIVRFTRAKLSFQLIAEAKRLWNVPLQSLPDVVIAKLTLLKSRLPKGIQDDLTSNANTHSEIETLPTHEYNGTAASSSNATNGGCPEEVSTFLADSVMEDLPQVDVKRKRVRRHRKRNKVNENEEEFPVCSPSITPINVPKPKNHIRFNSEGESPVTPYLENGSKNSLPIADVSRGTANSDESKTVFPVPSNMAKPLSPAVEINSSTENNTDNAKTYVGGRRRKGHKVFALGEFLSKMRSNGVSDEGCLEETDRSESSFEGSSKKRCNLQNDQADHSSQENIVNTSFDNVLNLNQKTELVTGSSVIKWEANDSLEQLLSLRKVYGSPPVFLLNKNGEETVPKTE